MPPTTQERVFEDFSGGMNALAAVDKLDPKECLLAENVRLDETGNIQSAGALTHQNSAIYTASAGSNVQNVHSLYWNPSFGAVAGVGQDVFTGPTLGGMTNQLAAQNTMQQKMSFASGISRVYFDIGSVGYWTDLNNLLTVDWPPPIAVGATITGPTVVGTGVLTSDALHTVAWTNPNNITSTTTVSVATASVTYGGAGSTQWLKATMTTSSFAISTVAVTGVQVNVVVEQAANSPGQWQINILKGGVPVGTIKSQPAIYQVPGIFTTITFGGSTDLWGTTFTQADINSGTLGFQLCFLLTSSPSEIVKCYQGQLTIYQGAGFVAGTGGAGPLSGSYSYKVTFVDGIGEESDASNPTNTVVLSNQNGSLTAIQTGDARTTARNVYRKGNTLTSYYFVGNIADNSTTTYTDNQSDLNALATGVILAGDVPGDQPNTRFGPTTIARFPALHYDRIFWVNQIKQNQLIWSKPLNGFAYPAVNQINVGDSKPISRIVSIFGELIIIKTDSIWRLTGTDESSFQLAQTPSSVGTDMSFTVFALPDKVIFVNRWGPWLFNGYTSQPITPKLDLWFQKQDRSGSSLFGVNGFHPIEVAAANPPLNYEIVGNSEKFYFAYAESGQTANNAIVRFDLKHNNITKRTISGDAPLALAIDPVTGFVYNGGTAGFVSLLDDWLGANDAGSNVNFDYQHGYQDLQRGSNKGLYALEFFLNTNGQSLTPFVYYDGGKASETLAPITTNGLQRVVRTVQATNARKMQNFSWRLNGSVSTVNSSGVPQIEIVHVKALYQIYPGRARTGQ